MTTKTQKTTKTVAPKSSKLVKKTAAKTRPAVKPIANGSTAEKVREVWGTRAGTNLDNLVAILAEAKGKPILMSEITKKMYGKLDESNRNKVKMVLVGLNMTIDAYQLPYAKVALVGRGEEATLALAPKSKK
jgi:hypothetical protein